MKRQRYDIFISYRRKGGDVTARSIYDRLTMMGYRVSYDIETLRSGKFNTQLYRRIEECKDVIAIMSADAFELRDNIEDDWFRLEIAHAVKHGKNIVPVFLRDFKMPAAGSLPKDIADVVEFQGVTHTAEHFDSVLNKLCRLLKSRRVGFIKKILSIFALLIAVFFGGFSVWLFRAELFPYPFTHHDRQIVQSVVANVANQCMYYDQMIGLCKELLDCAERCVTADEESTFDGSARAMKYGRRNIKLSNAAPTDRLLGDVAHSKIEQAELSVLYGLLKTKRDEMAMLPVELQTVVNRQCRMKKANRFKLIHLKERFMEIEADFFACCVMSLFRCVKDSALKDFKESLVPRWINIPLLSKQWIHDEVELTRRANMLMSELESITMELATLQGTESSELDKDVELFVKRLENLGATHDQAANMIDALAKTSNMKVEVSSIKANIESMKNEARDKFSPKMNDDVGTLWGKALRFMVLKMPEESKKCIDVLRRKNVADFPPAALDVAETILFSKTEELPFEAGLLVCMFEPPATSHAIYKIGDVITAVDGVPCREFKDYRAKAGQTYTIYRRESNGSFKRIVQKMPEGQPRVAIVNLIE